MNGAWPSVSVVIPTYNRPALLERAIRSALAQTHRDLEVIVSHDAGPSDVAGLLASLRDPRLRLICQARNTAKAGAFADGLRVAEGEFVLALDDDDMLPPHCIERLLAPLLADESLVVSFGDHWVIDAEDRVDHAASDESSRRWARADLPEGRHQPFVELALVTQALGMNHGALTRRSALDLDDFPLEVTVHTDYWLGYLASRGGGAAWYVGDRVFYLRYHDAMATNKPSAERYNSFVFIYDRLLADPRVAAVHMEMSRRRNMHEFSHAAWLLREGHRNQARSTARRLRRTSFPSLDIGVIEALSWIPVAGPAAARRIRRRG